MRPSKMSDVKARYMEIHATRKPKKNRRFFGPKNYGKFSGPADFSSPKFQEISWTKISDKALRKQRRRSTFWTNIFVVVRFWP